MKKNTEEIERYKKAKKSVLALDCLIIPMGIGCVLVPDTYGVIQTGLFCGVAALFIISMIVQWTMCNCPYCGKHFLAGAMYAKECPECHHKLP